MLCIVDETDNPGGGGEYDCGVCMSIAVVGAVLYDELVDIGVDIEA